MMKWDSPSLYRLSADCTLIPFTSMITVPLFNEMENTSDWNASTGVLTMEARGPQGGHVFNIYLWDCLEEHKTQERFAWKIISINSNKKILYCLDCYVTCELRHISVESGIFCIWTENSRWCCHAKELLFQCQLLSLLKHCSSVISLTCEKPVF